MSISQTIPVDRVLQRLNIGTEVYPPLPPSPTEDASTSTEGGEKAGAPDTLFPAALGSDRTWTERKCFYIFGVTFLGFAVITLIMMVIWKSATRSPWDGVSSLMIIIFVAYLVVGLLIIFFAKCVKSADRRACEHCCGELIITAAVAFAGLMIVGASMNGVHVKYTDAIFKLNFNQYAKEFSVPLETHIGELEHRRPVMTGLFIALVPFAIAFAVFSVGYYFLAFDDAQHSHAFGYMSLTLVFPTLISICGLGVCVSVSMIARRAPSPYTPIFRESEHILVGVSLTTLGFLVLFLILMCCCARISRDVSADRSCVVLLALLLVCAMVSVVFQLRVGYVGGTVPYEGACTDWYYLSNVCDNGTAGTDAAVSSSSSSPSSIINNSNNTSPSSFPFFYSSPSTSSTSPSSPSPPLSSLPLLPLPLPLSLPLSLVLSDDCVKVGENLYSYKYVSEGYYLKPRSPEGEKECFNLAELATNTHKQAVKGAEVIKKSAAWLSAFGVFVLALIVLGGCCTHCYTVLRRRGGVGGGVETIA